MMGFDYAKLNRSGPHDAEICVCARDAERQPRPGIALSRSTGLQQIVDYVKQNGYPNATVTGKDSIDFGDGYGDIDVLTSEGTWWWGPKN